MRLGIMGGTFDPIHLGHLHVARAALVEAALQSVLFLPDGDPPHKQPGASGEDRLRMTQLAIANDPAFWASDMELRRPGRTYTVDTLMELMREDPQRELYYLIGSDTLFQFPTWKTAHKVAALCSMLVVPRPGTDIDEVRWFMRKLFSDFGLTSALLTQPGPDISSTRIRARVKSGQDITALVPQAVAQYIAQHQLYQQDLT
ncbi:MAG: nicotinate-nucleotide adenylyltransferase [Clostridiales bacterium]|nr:nicotinate-nucleotide adenylyltransferase [Clostridiales bacterium]